MTSRRRYHQLPRVPVVGAGVKLVGRGERDCALEVVEENPFGGDLSTQLQHQTFLQIEHKFAASTHGKSDDYRNNCRKNIATNDDNRQVMLFMFTNTSAIR